MITKVRKLFTLVSLRQLLKTAAVSSMLVACLVFGSAFNYLPKENLAFHCVDSALFVANGAKCADQVATIIASNVAPSFESSIKDRLEGRVLKLDELAPIVERVSSEFMVSAELVWAVIEVESRGNVEAVSHRGAKGLMQLMPATANYLEVENPFDPEDNLRGGVRYLSELLREFDGNVVLALAAYNSGPTTVRRYNGVPPRKETQRFVMKVLSELRLTRLG